MRQYDGPLEERAARLAQPPQTQNTYVSSENFGPWYGSHAFAKDDIEFALVAASHDVDGLIGPGILAGPTGLKFVPESMLQYQRDALFNAVLIQAAFRLNDPPFPGPKPLCRPAHVLLQNTGLLIRDGESATSLPIFAVEGKQPKWLAFTHNLPELDDE